MAERQQPVGLAAGRSEQPLVVGIAADHSVQNDDVDRLHLVGDLCDVEEPTVDAVPHAGAVEQFDGFRLVVGGDLQVGRPGGPASQQLDLDLADAAADFEDARSRDSALGQEGHDRSRRPAQATFAVPPRHPAGRTGH
ncbi:MAG TPA: hypothetical protein VFD59_02540 [Nocardioidaceae bacterium]|nr:hypothetical protein [Nocardioidaceae bacterium]